jgi:hypothetical protein
MKTCSLYGFIWALAGALLALALYFLGFHSDLAKLAAAKWIGGVGGLTIAVVVMVLGIKARSAEIPVTQKFGYGGALLAGVQISIVASILNAAFAYIYYAFINPGFSELLLQDAMDKVQAKGVSGPQLDQVEKVTRFMMSPGMQVVTTLIAGFIFGFIIALILAAFLKRPEPAVPPPI